MRNLVVVEFVTLDGVMQGFGGPDEDRDGGFEHGGWGRPFMDDAQMRAASSAMASTSAYLFGRKTYEHMAAFWPHQPSDNPMAAHLNATPKFVATRTRTKLEWKGAQILQGELRDAVAELKASGDGSIVVLGSGDLVQELVADNLVDEFNLFLHPLVLGTGKRLFRSYPQPRRLRLVDVAPTSTGVLMLRYATA